MGVCDVPIISTVCTTTGHAAASLVAAPFDWLAQAMAGGASWLFQEVWTVFDSTTTVDITQAGYIGVYNILFGVAVFIMLIFFCLQLITGLIHRDPAAITRASLGLAKSVLGSFLVITLTGLLLQATDELCVGIVHATGTTMTGMGERITLLASGFTTISLAAPGAGAILTIFLAGLAISAAFIVWFSLLIRKALLLVAIVFAPIALTGATWNATNGWFSKWAGFVIALIASKLVLVVIFLVAITQVSAPINADLTSISQPVAGVVLMFIAAFAPYISYKFLHFAGFDMYHAMSSEQEAKSALNRPIPILSNPTSRHTARKVLDSGNSNSFPASPTAGGGASVAAGAGAGAGSIGGGGAAASGAAAGSGASGAGPVGAAVIAGATAVKAATAGPRAGSAIGATADKHAARAFDQTTPAAPPPAPRPAAPSTPPAARPTRTPPSGSKE